MPLGGWVPYWWKNTCHSGWLKLCCCMKLTLIIDVGTTPFYSCASQSLLASCYNTGFCQQRSDFTWATQVSLILTEAVGVALLPDCPPWHVAMQLIKNVCLRQGVRDHFAEANGKFVGRQRM